MAEFLDTDLIGWPRIFTSGIAELEIAMRVDASLQNPRKLHSRTAHL
jgi:hypothetical protein